MQQAQDKQKFYYYQKAKVPEFKQGDKVWLSVRKFPTGVSPKLCTKWDGPFFISQTGSYSTYKLTRCRTNKPVKSYIHANRLKPFNDPEFRTVIYKNVLQRPENENRQIQNRQMPTNQQQNVNDQQTPEQYYEIEKLMGKKQMNGKTDFKVKWVGYRETTWEPQEEIPPLPLQNYYKTHTMAGKRRKRKFFKFA